jgi:hypothetical protein
MQTLFIVGETPLADTVCVHPKVKASAKRIVRLLALLTFAD